MVCPQAHSAGADERMMPAGVAAHVVWTKLPVASLVSSARALTIGLWRQAGIAGETLSTTPFKRLKVVQEVCKLLSIGLRHSSHRIAWLSDPPRPHKNPPAQADLGMRPRMPPRQRPGRRPQVRSRS